MAFCGCLKSGSLTAVAVLALFGFFTNTSGADERVDWNGNLDCPEKMTVVWKAHHSRPPYVDKTSNISSHYRGILPDFLEFLLTECCRKRVNLVYNDSDTADSDLFLPTIVNLEADCNTNKPTNLVPIVPNTGIAFVVVKNSKSNQSMGMWKSLLATWPVLVLTLFLSLIAGMIAWSLEARRNSENFPSSFSKGTWEGFWWAFISMTTVGYGDRCPQSVGGRLFAVFWILVGICVCSVFTASLTSSLTTLSLETKISLPGARVVTLINSIEATTGFRNQANLTRVQTAREIHEQLESESVQGALMDAYSLVHFRKYYPTKKLQVQEIIAQGKLEYGVKVKNIELANCFREKRYTEESSLQEMAETTLESPLTSALGDEDKEEQSNLFDPEGLLFFPMLYTCVGITAVFIVGGVLWDLLHKCSLIKNKDTGRMHNMTVSFKKGNLLSRHVKCYISKEKLQELEDKIQDVNRTLDVLKNEIVVDRRFTHKNQNSNVCL